MPARPDTGGPREDAADGTEPRPARHPFEYAVIRVVPRVERGEFVNAAIILMCRPLRYLGISTELHDGILREMAPDCDLEAVHDQLRRLQGIVDGDPREGPIAALSLPERFHWLVSPSSTVVQPSEVHTGLTDDPAATLERLHRALLSRPPAGAGNRPR